MVLVDKKLRVDSFRFIKVFNKSPVEKDWPRTANYNASEIESLNLSEFGVVTGLGGLVVLDFDDAEFQDKILPLLPETFTVKTAGKGLFHLYFYTDDATTKRLDDSTGRRLADLQGHGCMVVGPGSLNKTTGRYYEVVRDVPLTFIKAETILSLFEMHGVVIGKKSNNDSPNKFFLEEFEDPIILEIKKIVKISTFLKHLKIDTSVNPTMCPLGHESESKTCFGFDDAVGVWHCFHCEERGNIFHLVQKVKGFDFKSAKNFLIKAAKIKIEDFVDFAEFDKSILSIDDNYKIIEYFHKYQPFFYDKALNFWLWDSSRFAWKMCDEIDILNSINQWFTLNGDILKPSRKNQMIDAIQMIGRQKTPEQPPESWVQFKDTIVDCRTGQEFPASPNYFFANPIPWELSNNDDTPTLDLLFKQWVDTDQKVDELYDILSYCALAAFPIHRAFIMVGSGRNGKSTYLHIINNFVGDDNCVTSDLELLTESRFESSRLYRKLVCSIGETNYGIIKKGGLIKQITGGDKVRMEFKNKDGFDFKIYAKIIIGTNEIPATDDHTTGWFSRWQIVEFKNRFADTKMRILDTIPPIEFSNLARKVVKRLKIILENGALANQGTYDERKKSYLQNSNSLEPFIHEYCMINSKEPTYFVKYSELYFFYNQYAKQTDKRILKRSEFKRCMEETYLLDKTTRNGETSYYFFGIKLKKEYLEQLKNQDDATDDEVWKR